MRVIQCGSDLVGKTMSLRFPFLTAALVACAVALPARAQRDFAPPPQIPYGLAIDIESAKLVAAAAIAEAEDNGWTMAVAIVDTGGHLVYFEKMDGTQTGSVDVSIDKARSAALFRRPTKVFEDGVAQGGAGIRLLRLQGAVPIDGGVPVILDGRVIGGIGISGGSGEQDGQVAQVGADALD
jgi:glc operon protein GlcG